jgi:prepilin-type N-terminal cleavage/methylation domain-containing protein
MAKKRKKINISAKDGSASGGKNEKGMTLLEVMVAVFIFSLIMVAVVQIFGSSASGYRNAVKIQRNLEDAQYAMNQITKTLRTSTVVKYDPEVEEIRVFDYSIPSDSDNCLEFKFDNSSEKKLMVGSERDDAQDDCNGSSPLTSPSFLSNKEMTVGRIENMKFDVVSSESGKVGKVTISMEVCADNSSSCSSATGKVQIQSTVSLRDYNISFTTP